MFKLHYLENKLVYQLSHDISIQCKINRSKITFKPTLKQIIKCKAKQKTNVLFIVLFNTNQPSYLETIH